MHTYAQPHALVCICNRVSCAHRKSCMRISCKPSLQLIELWKGLKDYQQREKKIERAAVTLSERDKDRVRSKGSNYATHPLSVYTPETLTTKHNVAVTRILLFHSTDSTSFFSFFSFFLSFFFLFSVIPFFPFGLISFLSFPFIELFFFPLSLPPSERGVVRYC